MQELTQKELKKYMKYIPKTGKLFWKKDRGRTAKKGQQVGFINKEGYRCTKLFGKEYKIARLIFLYMKGFFPKKQMDHINRIKDDNRWCNLREISQNKNMLNQGATKNSTTGIRGVSPYIYRGKKKTTRTWIVSIRTNGKQKTVGYYKNFDEAVLARWKSEVKYGYFEYCPNSTSYLYLKNKGLV